MVHTGLKYVSVPFTSDGSGPYFEREDGARFWEARHEEWRAYVTCTACLGYVRSTVEGMVRHACEGMCEDGC